MERPQAKLTKRGVNMSKTFWMVCDDERSIWGASDKSPTNALKIAQNRSLGQDVKLSRAVKCSKNIFDRLYFAISVDDWTMINDTAYFDSEINTNENCSEMRSLIDGAYDIVMLYKAETPAQIEWKSNWLEKARKHGANLE